jgi:predicted nucleotide-binding protein
MVKKRMSQDSEPDRTKLVRQVEDFKVELSKRLEIGEEIFNREIKAFPELETLKTEFYDWDDYNSELLKSAFNIPANEYKAEYDDCDQLLGLMDYASGRYDPNNPSYQLKDTKRKIEAKLSNLRQLLKKSDLIPSDSKKESPEPLKIPNSKNIFIIHGHDEKSLSDLTSMLRDDFKLNPYILKNLPNIGSPTIIEKFEFYAEQCGMAIALFTPDDIIEKEGEKYLQARPNVIYELGWFSAKLTRKNVLLLLKEGTDVFSDFQGILQIRFKEAVPEVFRELMLEFREKGIL